MKLRPYRGADGEEGYTFWCPGCGWTMGFRTKAGSTRPDAPTWTFNGDMDRPTFSPSLLAYWPKFDETGKEIGRETRCHLFLTDGMLQLLGDSPYPLAGQTVPLTERPERY